jgi:surface antigen
MRMTAVVAAIASCAVISAVHTASADALSPVELAFEQQTPTLIEDIALSTEQSKEETATELQELPEPIVHTVDRGETLISIAKLHETTWQKLYYKNINLEHPDQLNVGVELTIPNNDEVLQEREIPQPIVQEVTPSAQEASSSAPSQRTTSATSNNRTTNKPQRQGSVAGNSYTYGYCTWYVKNRRPDLPNNLGNADTWISRAAAQGYSTGSVPAVGAVAQAITGYMHVAVVDAVHGDGTVTVSEMNFKGWGVQSSRRVAASSFHYIY